MSDFCFWGNVLAGNLWKRARHLGTAGYGHICPCVLTAELLPTSAFYLGRDCQVRCSHLCLVHMTFFNLHVILGLLQKYYFMSYS